MKVINRLEIQDTLSIGVLPSSNTTFSGLFEEGGLVKKRGLGTIITKNETDYLPYVSNSFPSIFNYNVSTTHSNPNLVVSLNNQIAGTVFSAPKDLNGTPAFRMLQDSDLANTSLSNKANIDGSNINPTTWNNLTSGNSLMWGGQTYSIVSSGNPLLFMVYDDDTLVWRPATLADTKTVLGITSQVLNPTLQSVTDNGNSTTNNIIVPQVVTDISTTSQGIVPTNAGVKLWGSGNAQYGITVNSSDGGMDIMANQANAGEVRIWGGSDNNAPTMLFKFNVNNNTSFKELLVPNATASNHAVNLGQLSNYSKTDGSNITNVAQWKVKLQMTLEDVTNNGAGSFAPINIYGVDNFGSQTDNLTYKLYLSNNGISYGMKFSILGNGDGIIQQGRNDRNQVYNLLLNPFGGNIGIGTTNPQYKLDVFGNMSASGYFSKSLTTTNKQVAQPSGTTIYWGNPQINTHIFESTGIYSLQHHVSGVGNGDIWSAHNFNPNTKVNVSDVAYLNDTTNIVTNNPSSITQGNYLLNHGNNHLFGDYNTITGHDNFLDGFMTSVLGFNNKIANSAYANIIGSFNTIDNASRTSLFGFNLYSEQEGFYAIGQNNLIHNSVPYGSPSITFAIGNGSSSSNREDLVQGFSDNSFGFRGRAFYDSQTRDPNWFSQGNTLVDIDYVQSVMGSGGILTNNSLSYTPCPENVFGVAMRSNTMTIVDEDNFTACSEFNFFSLSGVVEGFISDGTIGNKVITRGVIHIPQNAVNPLLWAGVDSNPYLCVKYDGFTVVTEWMSHSQIYNYRKEIGYVVHKVGELIKKGTEYYLELNQEII